MRGKSSLLVLPLSFTANDITLTTVYTVAKSDDIFNQSVIRFRWRILITVINNDVVFIKRGSDSNDFK